MFFYNKNSIKCFIEMDNNICASCLNNDSNIILYDLKNVYDEKCIFKAHSKNINWIIKSNLNNLISCGKDGIIKIWPSITENFIKKSKEINQNKDNSKTYKTNNLINIYLNSILEYKSDNNDLENIEKMLNLNENQFLLISKKSIFLFQYIINNKAITNINLIKKDDTNYFFDMIDSFVIYHNKNQYISINTKKCLYLLNIPNFEIIKKINLKSMNKNSLIQLNKSQLLIYDDNYLKILDINKFECKLIVKNNNNNDFLLNMNDGTIIQSSLNGIKRFYQKTMEELPLLIQFNNEDDNNDSYNYENYIEKVLYMYKLKDERIIICYQNGKNEICNLKFI